MTASGPTGYQKDAVQNALDIFRYAEAQMQEAADAASRAAATAYNGCVLLEAPTGSGKTRMAGMIAEEFSKTYKHRHNTAIVWFWFTPFAGLVEQTVTAMRNDFPGLRLRNLYHERRSSGMASGDVFVTTWASVAASNRDTRRIRKNGDLSVSLDDFIPRLRERGFRIGVVVDEAHHGFTRAHESVNVYRKVMQPDFTLLITATPDDADVEKFRTAAGIQELHRIAVSRKDAVDAGLIKEGVKSIAYLALGDQRQLVDFALTALSDGWQMHNAIKRRLAAEGFDLIPLMLVQVGNSDSAVEEARKRLKRIGVPDSTIAWYTSTDPNDDLLAVAKDESKQVLIFKLAVALGFDAPRAFTLVSLRGAQDTNFGVQVVGRILRVHPLLQTHAAAKVLSELLRFGYVFLADAENQAGLTSAGEKINSIRTEMSGICPYTMVVQIAGENTIQVLQDGNQSTLLPEEYTHLEWVPPVETSANTRLSMLSQGLLSSLLLPTLDQLALARPSKSGRVSSGPVPGNTLWPLKQGIPRVFKTEQLPLSTDELVKCVGASVDIDERVLTTGLRRNVQLMRREINVFEGNIEVGQIQAKLSDADIARRAQGVLFDAQHIDPRDLFDVLLKRLEREYAQAGIDHPHEGDLIRALNLIMATFPNLVKRASRKCAAHYRVTVDTDVLPAQVEMPPNVKRSRLNVYGVMPQDLNSPETAFAELLDSNVSGTVEWWFRNEPRKSWSIGIVMPSGDRYYPDFVVKVTDRTLGNGILLVEIKGDHILNMGDTLDKIIAEHKIYRFPLMLLREPDGRFMTIRYNERMDKNEIDQIFRVENMSQY